MLTNKDVEKLKDTFATKEEMNKRFKETNRHFDVVAEDLKNTITLLAEQISGKNSETDEHENDHKTLKTDVSILKTKVIALESKIQ